MLDFSKLGKVPPRVSVLARRIRRDEPPVPLGREGLSREGRWHRMEDIARNVVMGQLPLDDTTAPILVEVIDSMRRRGRSSLLR